MNFENKEFVYFLKNSLISNNITSKSKMQRFLVSHILENTGSVRKNITYDYFKCLGWEDNIDIFKYYYKVNSVSDFLIKHINANYNILNLIFINSIESKILKLNNFSLKSIQNELKHTVPSIFNSKHWIELGYSKKKSINIVRHIQSSNSNKRLLKYTPEELSSQSVFSKEFWKNTNTPEKYKEFNYTCREHYSTDTDYQKMKESISERNSANIKLGLHDNFLKPNIISNKEVEFFDFIKQFINVNHLQYTINCRKHHGKIYFADGYIKLNNKIILIEFDGIYWHNVANDIKRDLNILETRDDIIGIIRISDKFFKKHRSKIKNSIDYGIKEIKSKENQTIRIY